MTTRNENSDHNDRNALSQRRHDRALAMLTASGAEGLTTADVRDDPTFDHHGAASGVLSRLRREGRVTRLVAKRGDKSVFVLPEHVGGRAVD